MLNFKKKKSIFTVFLFAVLMIIVIATIFVFIEKGQLTFGTTQASSDAVFESARTQTEKSDELKTTLPMTEQSESAEIISYRVDEHAIHQFSVNYMYMYYGNFSSRYESLLFSKPPTIKELRAKEQLLQYSLDNEKREEMFQNIYRLTSSFSEADYKKYDVVVFFTYYGSAATDFKLNSLTVENNRIKCNTDITAPYPHAAVMTGNIIAMTISKGQLTQAPEIQHIFNKDSIEESTRAVQ